LDSKDVRIFCEMAFKYPDYDRFTQRRISPGKIGEKLQLDKKTVQKRIEKMENEGFIKYYQATPNLALFGFNSLMMFAFEASDILVKDKAISGLRKKNKSENLLEIVDSLGPMFFATLAARSREENQARASRIVNEYGLKGMPGGMDRGMTKPSLLQPTKYDWKIIKHLRYDALRPTGEIADAVSLTRRMVDYRISKLLDSRVFFVRAMRNPQKMQGIIFYGLNLFVEDQDAVMNAISDIHGERIWLLFSPTKGVIVANLFAFSVEEPEEALRRSLGIVGVRQGFLTIVKEEIEPDRPSWIDDLIEEKVELQNV